MEYIDNTKRLKSFCSYFQYSIQEKNKQRPDQKTLQKRSCAFAQLLYFLYSGSFILGSGFDAFPAVAFLGAERGISHSLIQQKLFSVPPEEGGKFSPTPQFFQIWGAAHARRR